MHLCSPCSKELRLGATTTSISSASYTARYTSNNSVICDFTILLRGKPVIKGPMPHSSVKGKLVRGPIDSLKMLQTTINCLL